MKSLPWRSDEIIHKLRDRVWKYLSPASGPQQVLEAAALLQMDAADVARLGRLHFLLCEETGAFIREVPRLLRRLPTTSQFEEERSTERVRGAVQWPPTLVERAASGMPTLVISRPSERAYQTPENELLVFLLAEVIRLGQQTGWLASTTPGPAVVLRDRVSEATKWAQSRMLTETESRMPTPRSVARIRNGRHRRRFQPVLDAWASYQQLVAHLDRDALRALIEQEGLVTRTDATLFELLCLFDIIDALEGLAWAVQPLGLIDGSIRFSAGRDVERLDIWYQRCPKPLGSQSVHRRILREHVVPHSALRPDIVLRHSAATGSPRWLLIEAKMGDVRDVAGSARAALYDLLAYRAAFAPVLDHQAGAFGLGLVWGAELEPSTSNVMLATRDRLGVAIDRFLDINGDTRRRASYGGRSGRIAAGGE